MGEKTRERDVRTTEKRIARGQEGKFDGKRVISQFSLSLSRYTHKLMHFPPPLPSPPPSPEFPNRVAAVPGFLGNNSHEARPVAKKLFNVFS